MLMLRSPSFQDRKKGWIENWDRLFGTTLLRVKGQYYYSSINFIPLIKLEIGSVPCWGVLLLQEIEVTRRFLLTHKRKWHQILFLDNIPFKICNFFPFWIVNMDKSNVINIFNKESKIRNVGVNFSGQLTR